MPQETYYAKTMQGFEHLLAGELESLGAAHVKVRKRGISFRGGRALLYRVNVASRLSLRVLLPVGSFEATDAERLYRQIRKMEWSRYLDNRMTFAIDPVVHSPHFPHSHFAAQKAKDAIVDRFRHRTGLRPSVNRKDPDLLVNLHISGSRVTLSLDSSGESLHKRGYRTGNFEAPLNEVLAAGMILKTGWTGERDFLDPMCGSGTLVIEAGLIAAGISPGLFRKRYGFERWKDFDPALLEHVVRSLPEEKEVGVRITGRDRDPEAVSLVSRQIRQMGLERIIRVEQKDFFETENDLDTPLIVMNPPYGERMRPEDIEHLYNRIGSTLKHTYPGSDAWILTSSRKGLERIGLKPSARTELFNGPLACTYVHYQTFKGKWKARDNRSPHP